MRNKWEWFGIVKKVWELSVPLHSNLGISKDSHWKPKKGMLRNWVLGGKIWGNKWERLGCSGRIGSGVSPFSSLTFSKDSHWECKA